MEPEEITLKDAAAKLRWLENENLLMWERIGKMQDEINELDRRLDVLK